MKLGLTAIALAALLSLSPILKTAAVAQQPAVPDAPAPQAPPPLSGVESGAVTPGLGSGTEQSGTNSSSTTAPAQQQSSPLPAVMRLPTRLRFRLLLPSCPRPAKVLKKSPPCFTFRSTSLKSRSPSRTPKESWSPASPSATSESTKTIPRDPAPLHRRSLPALHRLCHRSEPDL